MSSIYTLWKFARPHTVIGTSLSVFALYLIAIAATNSLINLTNLGQTLGTLIACLCGNVYIVGLNQLFDAEIDKINKPNLPIASGELTQKQGIFIIIITGILSLIISAYLGKWLLITVAVSLLLGTAYSMPPIRLKRFPLLAAFCIFTVRGVVINLGLFLFFSKTLGGQEFLTPSVWTLTLFVLIFTVAIAIFKDVPDMEGDKKYKISTFTLLLGKELVFKIASSVIIICYLGMILAGMFWLPSVNSYFLVFSHVILLALLWLRSQNVDLEKRSGIRSFYQFIWKLFYLEYFFFTAACLL
ncbi:UbiA prenyltransferase [Gloeothece citriformis PCC 7424]|uniref:UbiA prenyltransferase n=1 Tax=Gloeothece citriformis (strain PCC 7424) TaxID=65393 RepID=B7K7Y8_GLOC7|nr:homogentisate phytyltransferase [Gloeothece citriformis]ACK68476.1 UbiA prenyltransferase [Gloeothece citriformis PCC 7424]